MKGMALSWRLILPARPGQEREIETVRSRIEKLWDDFELADAEDEARIEAEIETLQMRRRALSQPPETLMQLAGAPRLGIDPAAETWLRAQREDWAEAGTWNGTPPWEEFVAGYLDKHRGTYAISASRLEAIPVPEAPIEVAGPYGLDVSYLESLEDIDPVLVSEAYESHDANAMLDYKERLLSLVATELAVEPLVPDAKLVLGLAVCTANWLQFWGEHGIGFEPVHDGADDSDDE